MARPAEVVRQNGKKRIKRRRGEGIKSKIWVGISVGKSAAEPLPPSSISMVICVCVCVCACEGGIHRAE